MEVCGFYTKAALVRELSRSIPAEGQSDSIICSTNSRNEVREDQPKNQPGMNRPFR
jgi:hypothetical protein